MKESFEENLRDLSRFEKEHRKGKDVSNDPSISKKGRERLKNEFYKEFRTLFEEKEEWQNISEGGAKNMLAAQEKKQALMEDLQERFRAYDSNNCSEPLPSERVITYEDGNCYWENETHERVTVTLGELISDSEWSGLNNGYYLDPESVPRDIYRRYYLELTKQKLFELFDLQESMETYYDKNVPLEARWAAATAKGQIEKNRPDSTLPEGLRAEKMVKNLLWKAGFDCDADFKIVPATHLDDYEKKIDFIVRRKKYNRGVGVEDIEEENIYGIQFTTSTNPNELKKKNRTISKAKKQFIEKGVIDDIVLVQIPLKTSEKVYKDWVTNGKPPGGPDKLWDDATKKKILKGVFFGLMKPEEIEKTWQKMTLQDTKGKSNVEREEENNAREESASEAPNLETDRKDDSDKREGNDHRKKAIPKISNDEAEWENVLSHQIEEFLIDKPVVNSGNNGIIYRLSPEDISPEFSRVLSKKGIHIEGGGGAIKALKLFQRGAGAKEFSMLQTAERILASTRDAPQKPYAVVPSALLFKELTIDEKTKNVLNEYGARLIERKVEVLLMDYVNGEDLATKIIKQALLFKGVHENKLDMLSFEQLYLLGMELDLLLPKGKITAPGERRFEEWKFFVQSQEKLLQFLKKQDFALSQDIIDALKNTIAIFEKNNLSHNDLHERNVMIEGSLSYKPKVSVVDFGSALTWRNQEEKQEKLLLDDNNIIWRLKEFSKNQQDTEKQNTNKRKEELHALMSRLNGNPAWMEKYNRIKKSMEEADSERHHQVLDGAYPASPDDTGLDQFFALIEKLVEEDVLSPEEVKIFMEHKNQTSTHPFEKKKILEYMK